MVPTSVWQRLITRSPLGTDGSHFLPSVGGIPTYTVVEPQGVYTPNMVCFGLGAVHTYGLRITVSVGILPKKVPGGSPNGATALP